MTATMTPLSGAAATVGTHRSSGRYFLRRMVQYRPGFISFLVIILLYLAAFVGPLLYRRSPNEIDLLNLLGHPSAQHLLGTDDNGRDILARLLDGGHVSLIVGLIAVVIADTVGVLFGAFAGYFGKFTDAILMRITDALLAIPSFFLLLVVLSLFGPTLTKLEIAIGLTSWMAIARLVRSEFLRYKETDFVQAAKAMGASDVRVIFRHILPQAVSPVIVASSVLVGGAIILESALSYLGLGVQPPQASWGNMLTGAQNFVFTEPALAIYPGLLIVITVASFNYFGEGLRTAFNVAE
ncbi:MAG: ABC transporter permease [Thermomicrobia bacterium]|nr:ABC transporter permease [Thermomicrobia bacterium]